VHPHVDTITSSISTLGLKKSELKEVLGTRHQLEATAAKNRKAVNYYQAERRQRAEVMHTLQGPVQQRMEEKKRESSIEEMDQRLQIISKMLGKQKTVEPSFRSDDVLISI